MSRPAAAPATAPTATVTASHGGTTCQWSCQPVTGRRRAGPIRQFVAGTCNGHQHTASTYGNKAYHVEPISSPD